VDLDADGDQDILSGSYSRMSTDMAGLFQVLWRQADGSFRQAAELKGTDDQPLIIAHESDIERICTRPMAVDWDADGDLDLVVGNFLGTFYLFTGEGQGRFLPDAQQIMSSEGGPLQIHGQHSDPFPIDWDRDGDIDLVSGSSQGGVQWAENTAGPDKPPEFQSFSSLIAAGPAVPYGEPLEEAALKGPATSTRVWVDDINGDGKLDLLVGDSVTLIARAEGLTEEDFNRKKAEWERQWAEAGQRLQDAGDDEEAQAEAHQKLQELYGKRSEFITEDATGFVWLYLQK
jgi:hypothetical protein